MSVCIIHLGVKMAEFADGQVWPPAQRPFICQALTSWRDCSDTQDGTDEPPLAIVILKI